MSTLYCVYSIKLTEWIKTITFSRCFFSVEHLSIRELALWPPQSTLAQRPAINSVHWEDF